MEMDEYQFVCVSRHLETAPPFTAPCEGYEAQ